MKTLFTIKDTLLFNKYMINQNGEIFSTYTGRILKPSKNKGGYLTVKLKINDTESRTFNLHSLVFRIFKKEESVKIKSGHWVIDHIDGDKTNAKLSNLQLISHTENIRKG